MNGNVPEGWRRSRLGLHLREPIRNGYSPVCPKEPTGKWMAHLGAVTENGFRADAVKPAPANDARVDAARLEPGDLVVSRSNTRERVGLAGIYEGAPTPCSYPDLLMRVRTTADVDQRFLLFALLSRNGRRYFHSAARGTSGSMVKIDRSLLENFPLALPPLAEQREIAATLEAMDEAIAAGEAVLHELDAVRKRLALELITRGAERRHEEKVVAGPVTCPSAWRVMPVERAVSSCDYGLSCAMSLDASGVACLRMGNVQAGEVLLDDLKYVPQAQTTEGLLLRQGDVLFNRTNSKDLVGKVGLFRGSARPVTFASYLLRLRASPEIVTGEWLAAVLNLDPYQRLIRSIATPGISQVNVNRTRLLAIQVPIPTLDEQRAIIRPLDALSERTDRERATLEERRRVKVALADALLNGRLRVRDDG